jgi:hypothetical protein
MPTVPEYINDNREHFSTLYYPGPFYDLSPLEAFWKCVPESPIQKVFYVDYGMNIPSADWTNVNRIVHNILLDLVGIWPTMHHLTPETYHLGHWNNFWHTNPSSSSYLNAATACGRKIVAGGYEFTYLSTEAIGTYHVLLNNGIRPDVLVLQDHGMGGNWTRFGGGPGDLLYDMLVASGDLPKYLYVQPAPTGITEIYPGYIQVTDPYLPHFHRSMHPDQDHRALFIRVE